MKGNLCYYRNLGVECAKIAPPSASPVNGKSTRRGRGLSGVSGKRKILNLRCPVCVRPSGAFRASSPRDFPNVCGNFAHNAGSLENSRTEWTWNASRLALYSISCARRRFCSPCTRLSRYAFLPSNSTRYGHHFRTCIPFCSLYAALSFYALSPRTSAKWHGNCRMSRAIRASLLSALPRETFALNG